MPRFLSAAAIAWAALSATAEAETLRLGTITPPPHQWTISAESLAERLAKASGNELDLQVHPAGSLGNESQMLQQLQSGALDMAFLTIADLSARDADFGSLIAPCLVDDPTDATQLLQSAPAVELLAKLEDQGLHGLGFGMAGLRQIVLGGEWNGQDFGGLKIRTLPVPQEMDFWKKLGAAPTPMPLPALYDAFANGQIDGMQIDFEGTWNSRYYDKAGSILASDHMIFPMVAVFSARKWQALDEATRRLIEEQTAAELKVLHQAYADIDRKFRAELETTSVPVTDAHEQLCGLPGVAEWYAEWQAQSPLLTALRAEAATYAQR